MDEKRICLYHRIYKRENFEVAAKDIFSLLKKAQDEHPDQPRVLYVDIDGHRNDKGGYDRDMFELQKEFGINFLLQFFQEINFPLIHLKNAGIQNNNIPDELQILNQQNKSDNSLDKLYIENYSNTEFISEEEVYLENLSEFLREYNEYDCCENEVKSDRIRLVRIWHRYIKDIIIELFNNFLYGNFLSATAVTRTLIECYVYLKILLNEEDDQAITDWFTCCLVKKIANDEKGHKEIVELLKNYCNIWGYNYDEIYNKFSKRNTNIWLESVLSKKNVSFKDICCYIDEFYVYEDFQRICSFVHAQDISTKIMPFTFYSSIYEKLLLMSTYIFKTIRLFRVTEEMEYKIDKLEEELLLLGKNFL